MFYFENELKLNIEFISINLSVNRGELVAGNSNKCIIN